MVKGAWGISGKEVTARGGRASLDRSPLRRVPAFVDSDAREVGQDRPGRWVLPASIRTHDRNRSRRGVLGR